MGEISSVVRKSKYDLFYIYFVGFIVFSFIIDSGGPIGIRNFSFLLMSLYCFIKTIYDLKFYCYNVFLLMLIVVVYLFGINALLVSSLNDIELSKSIIWILPFFAAPLFYLFFSGFNRNVIVKSVVLTGWLLAAVILVVFILLLCYGDSVTSFFKDNKIPGWFYIRENGYPNVYFQSTLALVMISLFSYFNGYRVTSFLLFFILLLCLSRFGAFVIFSVYILNLIMPKQVLFRLTVPFYLCVSVFFLPVCFFIYVYLPNDINYSDVDFLIRFGHLKSIVDSYTSPWQLIFGYGAGSEIYSVGFNAVTDNIEVSQLEVLRKYGVFGYTIISSIFYLVFLFLKKRGSISGTLSLISFYIVSYSNPVLLTLACAIFVAIFMNSEEDCHVDSEHNQGKITKPRDFKGLPG